MKDRGGVLSITGTITLLCFNHGFVQTSPNISSQVIDDYRYGCQLTQCF